VWQGIIGNHEKKPTKQANAATDIRLNLDAALRCQRQAQRPHAQIMI